MLDPSRRQFLTTSLGTLGLSVAYRDSRSAEPLPATSEPTKLHAGFKFTEGPAADPRGNLYFSDIPNNRIHKIDADGKLSTFLENSRACNGLMIDSRGRLVACQGDEKRLIAIDLASKSVDVLADKCDRKPLGTPNDLVVDQTGGVYFNNLVDRIHLTAGQAGVRAVGVPDLIRARSLTPPYPHPWATAGGCSRVGAGTSEGHTFGRRGGRCRYPQRQRRAQPPDSRCRPGTAFATLSTPAVARVRMGG